MLLIKATVRTSPIAGLGLFAEEPVPIGSVAAIYSHGLSLIPESEYVARTAAGDEVAIKTACRYIHDIYIIRESGVEDEDYVNHSFTPNMLYHCGICFARREITPGEELTINYQYVLSPREEGFVDSLTGRYVAGLSNNQVLFRTSREIVALMRACLAGETRSKVVAYPAAMKARVRRQRRSKPA
ncbi:MAG: SET domain-containing protein [Thermodesulfobacteriota bacterium]